MVKKRIQVLPIPRWELQPQLYSNSLFIIFWYIFTHQWSSFIFWNFKVYDAFQFLSLWERHITNIGQRLAKSCPNLTRLSSVGGGSNDFPLTWVADMKSAKNHSLFAPGNTGATLQRGGGGGGGQRGGSEVCLCPLLCSMWQKRVAAALKKK